MNEGLDPHCLELGGDPEHRLLRWATGYARKNKDHEVRLRRDQIFFRAELEAGAGRVCFNHLEDAGFIERVEVGESYRYQVLVFCTCPGEDPPQPNSAPWRESSLRLGDPRVGLLDSSLVAGDFNGVKSESAQKPVTTTYLSKYFFPKVVRAAGIQMNVLLTNGAALTSHLNRWRAQGIDTLTMQQMMEEFAKHPDWCRKSKRSPWQVFVSRRSELAAIVAHHQQRSDGLRHKGYDHWLNRRTPRAVSPA